MKSTYFELRKPEYQTGWVEPHYEKKWVTYKIPILPAYAISSYSIQGMKMNVDAGAAPVTSELEGETVTIYGVDEFFDRLTPGEPTLAINYLGIRNYEKFFPHFTNLELRARAALFMEEADKTFEQSSWLSFVLMAGAVFESFLVELTGDGKSALGKLITNVETSGIFSKDEISTLRETSQARNLVHAGKFGDEYVSREKAMSVRLALEEFLRKDWVEISGNWKN